MNTKNLLLKIVLFVVLPVVLSIWLFTTHGIKWGIDIRGGHSLTFEINTPQKDVDRLTAQKADLAKQLAAQADPQQKKAIEDRIAALDKQISDLQSSGDQPDLIGQIISILKKRIDPNGLLALEWRPLGKTRFEVRMPAARSQDEKNAYVAALEKVKGGNIQPSELSQMLAASGESREQIIAQLSHGDANLTKKLTELADAHDVYIKARQASDAARAAGQGGEALDALDTAAAKSQMVYEDKYEAVLAANISETKLQNVLRLWVSPAEEAALNNKTVVSARMRQFDQGIKQLTANNPSRKAEIEEIVKLYQRWVETRKGLDDPSDLKRLIAKAGVLEFRIAPTKTGTEKQPAINPELVQQYVAELANEGPDAGHKKGLPYQWFPIRGDHEEYEGSGYIVAPYAGQWYMLLSNSRNDVMLQRGPGAGWSLRNARPEPDEYGRPAVGFSFNQLGADRFYELTSTHIGQPMAVLLDDEVYSAPNIRSAISDRGIITGSFTRTEVDELAQTLNAGSLPARLNVVDTPAGKMAVTVSESSFGPSFGEENKNQALKAGYWSLIVIALFMMVYYLLAGFIADFAMIMNLVLIMGAMSFINAVFTLPGLAGVILSIGMAVDANVLIYERLREEQDRGQSVRMALKNAYERAFSAIFDSNITTLLTCLILGWVGTEEVRGFAITLGLGVLFNLFTAVTVTRWIFQLMLEKGLVKKRFSMMRLIGVPKVDWMAKRYYFWTFSAVTGVLGLAALIWQGQNILGIEFSSGTQAIVRLKDAQLIQDPSTGQQVLPNDAVVKERVAEVAAKHGWTKLQGELLRAEKLIDPNLVSEFLNRHFRQQDFPNVQAEKKITAQQWKQANLGQGYFDALDANKDAVLSSDELERMPQNAYQLATTESDGEAVRTAIREAFPSELATMTKVKYTLAKGGHQEKFNIDLAPTGATVISPKAIESADKTLRGQLENFQGGLLIVLKDMEPAIKTDDLLQRINAIQYQQDFTGQISTFGVIGLEAASAPDAYTSVAVLVKPAEAVGQDKTMADFANEKLALVAGALSREEAMEVVNFDPAIAGEARNLAIIAIVLGWLSIIAYLWIRFGSAKWGFAAVLCIVHDVVIIVGLVAISGYIYNTAIGQALLIGSFKIDLTMVAALLTIIGYSVNDTIVVFDRIRENRGKLTTLSPQVVNSAINQTLSRTILTGSTVMVVVFIMYVWGGPGIHAFNFALLAGIMFGTYSSIAVAAPMLMGFKAALGKRAMSDAVGK